MKTFGPWHVADQSYGGRYINVRDSNNRVVCRVPFSGENDKHPDDNDRAIVIAKAPAAAKLADALRTMLNAPSGMSAYWYEGIARAALAEYDRSK